MSSLSNGKPAAAAAPAAPVQPEPPATYLQIARVLAMMAYHNTLTFVWIVIGLSINSLWLVYAFFRSCFSRRSPTLDWTDRSDVPPAVGSTQSYRICVIGAGFSGIGTVIKLKQMGMTTDDLLVLERAHAVGGTWRDNQYPSCACDVPSTLYSYSFEPNPDWEYHYARQPEIRAYLEHCTNKYGVRPFIRFGYSLVGATWDEARMQWKVTAKRVPYYNGDGEEVSAPASAAASNPETLELFANFVVHAAGGLTEPQIPKTPGLANFKGAVFHSARWNNKYDLTGKRVAVVGSGASAVQIVPTIQPKVAHMVLFQRTPSWVVPRYDFKFSALRKWLYRHIPILQTLARGIIYWRNELLLLHMVYRSPLMAAMTPLARVFLHMSVKDPELRRKLTPSFALGCKRVLVSNDWYPAITSPNVTNVFAALREVKANSVIGADGVEHPVDAIIFATGFQVHAQDKDREAVPPVIGVNGASLLDAMSVPASAYLGISIRDFPNYFMMLGPNTGLGHNTIIFMIEAQINYIAQIVAHLHQNGKRMASVKKELVREYNERLQRDLKGTVWSSGGCRSWYLDKDGANTTLFPYSTIQYYLLTENLKPDDYIIR